MMSVKRSFKILLSVIITVAIISGMIPEVSYAKGAETKHSTEWMLEIPDDTFVSSVTIPGTHNSGAVNIFPGYFVQCQNQDIPTQLVNGFRYFDFHLAISTDSDGKKRLNFANGIWNARTKFNIFSGKLYFDAVVEKIASFLKAHPSETVIIGVKKERSEDNAREFQQAVLDEINKQPELWYIKNRIPRIGEVRGKIIFARCYTDVTGAVDSGLNFNWTSQDSPEVVPLPYEAHSINMKSTLWVQDRHKYNLENKINAYRDTLTDAQAGGDDFVLNFLSTESTGLFSHPKHFAKYLNSDLLEYKLSSNTSYGVIAVDFANKDIAKHIYNSNFKELDKTE